MDTDILVVGAGPVGLCFARSLHGSGLRVTLVDKQPREALADPADDGREIAITHHSRRLLESMGLWSRIAETDIGLLRDAKVLDGNRGPTLLFRHQEAGKDQLGWLVSNHAIRRAAFAEVEGLDEVTLISGTGTRAVRMTDEGAQVVLDNGDTLTAQMLVAADSRFSSTRRALGIGARMHDFGKTMLVLRMRHEIGHEHTAWEWFCQGQTLALLPLHDPHVSSLVLTLPQHAMDKLLALDDVALGEEISRRFGHRVGAMRVAGPRCSYPLVGTYSHRFVDTRLALIGDAAVGMHPVTAHGFNFGVMGQATLAAELQQAIRNGHAAWDPTALRNYQRRHRLATLPLYTATQALAELYTDDRLPARAVRKLALAAAKHVRPFRRMVLSGLTSEERSLPSPLRRLFKSAPVAT